MMSGVITKEITINAPVAAVWSFVGAEAGLRQWWQLDVQFEASVGGRCTERGLLHGVPYQLTGIVTVYDPPHRLELLLSGDPVAGLQPPTMRIAITLVAHAGATVVRVAHQLASTVNAGAWPAEPVIDPCWQPAPIMQHGSGRGAKPRPLDATQTVRVVSNTTASEEMWRTAYAAHWVTRLISLLQLTTTAHSAS